MTHEAAYTVPWMQRLARVLRYVLLPCADDIRRGYPVPACADVADVVAAMTKKDNQLYEECNMSDNINEVRERLDAAVAAPLTTCTVVCSRKDPHALLADHARLQADAAKRATGQPLCDLCQQREEVRSDADGIPFCQECWDGWQASNGEGRANIRSSS